MKYPFNLDVGGVGDGKLVDVYFLYITLPQILNVTVGWAGGGWGMGVSHRRLRGKSATYSDNLHVATHPNPTSIPTA